MKKLIIFLAVFAFLAHAYLRSVQGSLQAGTSPVASDPNAIKRIVQERLLTPLEKKEKHSPLLTREMPPPSKRRVRILDSSPRKDSLGRLFVSFAIDDSHLPEPSESRDSDWRKSAMIGCVYPKTGRILIQQGKNYYPSSFLLGERVRAVSEDVCQGQ